jgi:hypothetical protein
MCIVGLVQTGPITYNLQTIDSTGNIHDYHVQRVVYTAEPDHEAFSGV